MKQDVYERITNRIVAELEQGVRPWLKPWNAEHAAGRITRPRRSNGQPYRGINVLMLWGEASRETTRLEKGETRIQNMETKAKADGTVTKAEKRRITAAQNVESKRIAVQKHDAQTQATQK